MSDVQGNINAKGDDGQSFPDRAPDGNQPGQANKGANGVDHWNGDDPPKRGDDATAFPSMRGNDGARGGDGRDGTDLILDINGTIEGVNVDARGGRGGNGQDGGNGAKGQQGGDGGTAADTGDPAGAGGNGGPGGDGGRGGDGGDGGRGGHITMTATEIVATSVETHADGGDGGLPGHPGIGGHPGDAGHGSPDGQPGQAAGSNGPPAKPGGKGAFGGVFAHTRS